MLRQSLNYFLILLVMFLPAFYMQEGILIGGDWIVPFDSEALSKYLYHWLPKNNGYYVTMYYSPLYLLYTIFNLFTDDIYTMNTLFVLCIRLIGALGVYYLVKFIYGAKLDFNVSFAICFFLLSPAFFNAHPYWLIYYLIPWFFYFVVKFIVQKRLTYLDVLGINIVLFFSCLDLPNPKYLFFYFTMFIVSVVFSVFIGKISGRELFQSSFKVLLILGVSAYILLPLGYFAAHYNPAEYGIGVKQNYSDDPNFFMMDFGGSTMDRMVRLFNDGMAVPPDVKKAYLSNPIMTIASYSFIGLIVFYFLVGCKKSFYDYWFFVLAMIFLLLSAGPNPPLGFLYDYLVGNFSLLGFLRTTAGAVFFVSLLYALLLYSILRNYDNKYLNLSAWFCLLLASYPLVFGQSYTSWSSINRFATMGQKYGFQVPESYFKFRSMVDSKKLEARTLIPGTDLAYVNTNWGFFGPGQFYDMLYKDNYFISSKFIFSSLHRHNVGYLLYDGSIINNDKYVVDEDVYQPLGKNDFLEYYGMKPGHFLPRVFAPSQIVFHSSFLYLDPVDSVSASVGDVKLVEKVDFTRKPTLEFKKISPTKLRVVAHGVKSNFMLVLSEKFDSSWRLYVGDHSKNIQHSSLTKLIRPGYKVLVNNELEQAGAVELDNYIKKGWISTLGEGEVRMMNHYIDDSRNRKIDLSESYSVDFISKDFYGTIQNDNLPDGGMLEGVPLLSEGGEHLRVNVYANAWMVDKEYVRKNFSELIVENPDGSFDMEVIVEFYPQRLFIICVVFSLALGGVILLAWLWNIKGKAREVKEPEILEENV